MLLLILTLY